MCLIALSVSIFTDIYIYFSTLNGWSFMRSPPAHCETLPPKTISACITVQSWCKVGANLLDTPGWTQRSKGGNGPVALHLSAVPGAVLLLSHVRGGERLCRLFPISPCK